MTKSLHTICGVFAAILTAALLLLAIPRPTAAHAAGAGLFAGATVSVRIEYRTEDDFDQKDYGPIDYGNLEPVAAEPKEGFDGIDLYATAGAERFAAVYREETTYTVKSVTFRINLAKAFKIETYEDLVLPTGGAFDYVTIYPVEGDPIGFPPLPGQTEQNAEKLAGITICAISYMHAYAPQDSIPVYARGTSVEDPFTPPPAPEEKPSTDQTVEEAKTFVQENKALFIILGVSATILILVLIFGRRRR